MNKRLFIGFPVEISSSLEAALKRVRMNAQQKHMEFNWVPEANFHVTLNFLGNTPTSRLDELEELMKNVAASSPPIKSSLRGMGGFPDERHMRVLWVGVRKSRALGALQERLREALLEKDFPQEDREYIPHLTVGRTRKVRSGTDLLSPYVRTAFGDFDIRSFTLFESLLCGGHPVYKPLANFELTGASEEEAV